MNTLTLIYYIVKIGNILIRGIINIRAFLIKKRRNKQKTKRQGNPKRNRKKAHIAPYIKNIKKTASELTYSLL